MNTFGNICLALAALIFLGPFQANLHGPIEAPQHGMTKSLVNVTLCLIPMGLLLTLALCAATSRGGLDWLGWARSGQYWMVIVTSLAFVVVTWFSGAMRGEDASQMPRVIYPFVPWAAYLLPLGIILFCAAVLNPGVGASVPAWAVRVPLITSAALSLLISVALLGELFVSTQRRANARLEETIRNQNQRDENYLQEVRALDANSAEALRELLNFTNQAENPAIREVALQKVLSRPHLTADIAGCLRGGCWEEAFTFLEGNTAPDPQALAEPIRDGFEQAAADVLKRMQSDEHLYDDTFDWNASKMLAIADKFQSYGVNYAPALRNYRKALDQPRSQKINPGCRASLDRWLAKAK